MSSNQKPDSKNVGSGTAQSTQPAVGVVVPLPNAKTEALHHVPNVPRGPSDASQGRYRAPEGVGRGTATAAEPAADPFKRAEIRLGYEQILEFAGHRLTPEPLERIYDTSELAPDPSLARASRISWVRWLWPLALAAVAAAFVAGAYVAMERVGTTKATKAEPKQDPVPVKPTVVNAPPQVAQSTPTPSVAPSRSQAETAQPRPVPVPSKKAASTASKRPALPEKLPSPEGHTKPAPPTDPFEQSAIAPIN